MSSKFWLWKPLRRVSKTGYVKRKDRRSMNSNDGLCATYSYYQSDANYLYHKAWDLSF